VLERECEDEIWIMDVTGIEPVRWIVGAGRHTLYNPRSLADFDPRAKFRYRDWAPDHVSYHLAQGYPPPRLL
jgi:hypothetical protein